VTRWALQLPTMGVHATADARGVLDAATLAEELGCQRLWAGDHLAWHVPCLEPTAVLAASAACTRTVGLGTAVALLPLRHPVRLAQSAATIDRLSGGRFALGLGAGTTAGDDFRAAGVEPSERANRMNIGVEVCRRLLDGVAIQRHTPWGHLDAHLDPTPAQGHLPLWFGGSSEAALRRTARWGDGWIAAFAGPDRLARKLRRLREEVEAAGRSPEEVSVAALAHVELDEDQSAALRRADAHLRAMYRTSAEHLAGSSAFGPAARVRDLVDAYAAVGVDQVIVGLVSNRVEHNLHAVAEALT
jgi:probable F420-dependent oxidoreductase